LGKSAKIGRVPAIRRADWEGNDINFYHRPESEVK